MKRRKPLFIVQVFGDVESGEANYLTINKNTGFYEQSYLAQADLLKDVRDLVEIRRYKTINKYHLQLERKGHR